MAVLLKNGGVWRTTPAGGVSIKYNGQWFRANKVYIKEGGVWRDSGYVGYPNTPASMWVNDWTSWGFTSVQVAWNYATGGAPATSYDVEMLNSGDGVIAQNYGVTANYTNFSVAEDYVVKFRVRSSSAAGLKSAWTNHNLAGVRARIGHTELSHVEPFYVVIPYVPAAIQIDLHTGSGGSAGVYIPGHVTVDHFEVHLWSAGLPTWLSAESLPQRHVHYIINDVVRSDLGAITLYNPHDGNLWISGAGGGNWGLYPWGTDYETGPYGVNRVNGSMQVFGTYVDTRYRTVIDRAYAANSYW